MDMAPLLQLLCVTELDRLRVWAHPQDAESPPAASRASYMQPSKAPWGIFAIIAWQVRVCAVPRG